MQIRPVALAAALSIAALVAVPGCGSGGRGATPAAGEPADYADREGLLACLKAWKSAAPDLPEFVEAFTPALAYAVTPFRRAALTGDDGSPDGEAFARQGIRELHHWGLPWRTIEKAFAEIENARALGERPRPLDVQGAWLEAADVQLVEMALAHKWPGRDRADLPGRLVPVLDAYEAALERRRQDPRVKAWLADPPKRWSAPKVE